MPVFKKRRCIRRVAAVLVVAVAVAWGLGLLGARLRATVLPEETIRVQGVPRHYRLVIPHSPDARTPAPVLFAFHGAGDTPEQMARYTQLDQLAASKGLYLVYPQGLHLSWPPFIPADNPEYVERDLAFFDTLCRDLNARYPVDEKRVYVAGMSQGAAFVSLLVAKRSDKLAAAVSHSGWLADPLSEEGIHAQRKCPVMFIAGSEDRQISPDAVKEAYTCFGREGHPVEFCLIEGLGHRWALEHDVNERMWRFLQRYRLP